MRGLPKLLRSALCSGASATSAVSDRDSTADRKRSDMDLGAPSADGLTVEVALNWLGILVVVVFVGHMIRYATMGVTLSKAKGKAE